MQITHLNLAGGFRGGERQTELLVRALAAQGWRQTVVARRGGALAERLAALPGVALRRVRPSLAAVLPALADSRLVHVHEGRSARAAWLNRRLRGTPYLITRRVQHGPRKHWLNRRIHRDAAACVAVSAAIGESLQRLVPGLPVQLIRDAISEFPADPERAAAIRRRYLGAGDGLLVGNVAALVDAHKGQRQIIEVARRLGDAQPPLVFLLIGSGPDEPRLRAAAAGLDRLHFTGFVDEVGDYLAALDIFYYPSRHEGLGSVLLDAMAFGLPVVATRVGGIPEIVDEPDNGFLCAVDDLEAQAAALTRLAQHADLRARIGASNRRHAADFAPANMAAAYIALYNELAAGGAGDRQA
ncbi:MAG: glycosyltransferase family 1 protein [Gammaproteobacteria bacterium]|nr:MAG: glycosyltransferase family 1 protein [Gammaproteobacteria bacterium]